MVLTNMKLTFQRLRLPLRCLLSMYTWGSKLNCPWVALEELVEKFELVLSTTEPLLSTIITNSVAVIYNSTSSSTTFKWKSEPMHRFETCKF